MSTARVEIYCGEDTLELSPLFLSQLAKGWEATLSELQQIGVGEIAKLEALEIALLNDSEMTRVHAEFLGEPTPTDVITFQHGELLIGIEVAERQSVEYGQPFEKEVALYGIHGMLHLAGFDDQSPEEAQKMGWRQRELLANHFTEF